MVRHELKEGGIVEPNLNSSESDPENGLLRILADMLRSALAWEAQRTCKFKIVLNLKITGLRFPATASRKTNGRCCGLTWRRIA